MSEAQSVSILVVDDSSFNRLVLKRRLAELGYATVTVAEDGLQGLAAIRGERYDVVLLDLEMPNLDGIGVLEELHQDGGAAPPVIVISALTEMDKIVRCIELGAEDYLPKSFDPRCCGPGWVRCWRRSGCATWPTSASRRWRRNWNPPAPRNSPWCP